MRGCAICVALPCACDKSHTLGGRDSNAGLWLYGALVLSLESIYDVCDLPDLQCLH